MKHVFIINPAAGAGAKDELMKKLSGLGDTITVYETQRPGDGKRFIKEYMLTCGEKTRFYACGGDGTIQETAEGIIGSENADMSCYPCGTGNDFIKCFGEKELFMDIEKLMRAESFPVDLIRVDGRTAINMVHFGFDTYVARTMAEVKNKKLIGGKNAYTYGVFKALFKAVKNRAEIYADGERLDTDGSFMLCTAANGQYVGGQFRCSPRSLYNDGLMDICVVKPVSIPKFMRLVPFYAAGTYLDDPRFEPITTYRRCKKLEVNAQAGFAISLDGEIVETEHFTCEILPSAIRFAAPLPEKS